MYSVAHFFEALYKNAPADSVTEFRLIEEGTGRIKRWWRPVSRIAGQDWAGFYAMNRHFHIYHRVNVSQGESSRKDDITGVVALYVDVDDASPEAYWRLESVDPPPSAIISSGGGFHGYWFLRQPTTRLDDAERAMKGLIHKAGADPAVHDVTRILRTPGFYNIKAAYPEPRPVEINYIDDAYYGFDFLYRQLAPLVRDTEPRVLRKLPQVKIDDKEYIPPYVQEYIASGAPEGERNIKLYIAARCLLDADKSQGEAELMLAGTARATGLSDSEIKQTIASAFSKSPSPRVSRTMRARYAMGDN